MGQSTHQQAHVNESVVGRERETVYGRLHKRSGHEHHRTEYSGGMIEHGRASYFCVHSKVSHEHPEAQLLSPVLGPEI